jgi:hypothetical protein
MTGLREIQPEKGSMGVRFLNTSQPHLWEVEQEQTAQRPQKATQVGWIPARVEECFDCFEASLRETRKAL